MIDTAALLERLRRDTFADSQRSVGEFDPTFRAAWNAAMFHVASVIVPEVIAAAELAAMSPVPAVDERLEAERARILARRPHPRDPAYRATVQAQPTAPSLAIPPQAIAEEVGPAGGESGVFLHAADCDSWSGEGCSREPGCKEGK